MAAVEAADAGKSVILLDQEGAASLGGQAWWSLGGLFLVDTPEQRRLGIKDSAELALADWLGSAGLRPAGGPLAAAMGGGVRRVRRRREAGAGSRNSASRSSRSCSWAERGGYQVGGHGNSVPRFHLVWGIRTRSADAIRRGGSLEHVHDGRVQIRYRHRVTELIRDGRVTGVTR